MDNSWIIVAALKWVVGGPQIKFCFRPPKILDCPCRTALWLCDDITGSAQSNQRDEYSDNPNSQVIENKSVFLTLYIMASVL